MSGWRTRSCGIVAGVALTVVLGACGSSARQGANEPSGNFTVAVPTATFPASQRLAEHTHMVIAVRNESGKTIPNVAVSVCNVTCAYPAPAGAGTAAEPFATDLNQPYLASRSRPVWIVDRPPGQCGYSCQQGGPGGAVTAYANTWALGALRPGDTATFDWGVTAIKPGKYVVAWAVAAGLNGKAKAILPDGSPPHGTFTVRISSAPPQSYVNDQGQVVTKPPAH